MEALDTAANVAWVMIYIVMANDVWVSECFPVKHRKVVVWYLLFHVFKSLSGLTGYFLISISKFLGAAVRQFLLFSSQLAVRGIPFNLSSQEDIILPVTGSPSYFVGVDFSAEDDSIFFSDTAKDIIYKQKVDGTGECL